MITQCKLYPHIKDNNLELCNGSFESIFAKEKDLSQAKFNLDFSRHPGRRKGGCSERRVGDARMDMG